MVENIRGYYTLIQVNGEGRCLEGEGRCLEGEGW